MNAKMAIASVVATTQMASQRLSRMRSNGSETIHSAHQRPARVRAPTMHTAAAISARSPIARPRPGRNVPATAEDPATSRPKRVAWVRTSEPPWGAAASASGVRISVIDLVGEVRCSDLTASAAEFVEHIVGLDRRTVVFDGAVGGGSVGSVTEVVDEGGSIGRP